MSQRFAFSPVTPSQCQPPAVVYQAIHPRVEIGVCAAVVKSGSTSSAAGAPDASVHCRWPSVQNPAGAGAEPPARRTKASLAVFPACLTVPVAATVLRLARRFATLLETRRTALARFAAQR